LNEALDYNRSRTQAIYVEILQKNKKSVATMVVFGVIAVVYGFSIYYFLPLSLLSFNFALILRIFFFILLGMLFGLSLLALNVQSLLEIALTYILLFFEKKSMKQLVLKNLIAHKLRNRLTAIIYSLALGFIIFLIVSYKLQVDSTILMTQKEKGTYFLLNNYKGDAMSPSRIEPIIARNMDKISSFSWVTADIVNFEGNQVKDVYLSDFSRLNKKYTGTYGVTPNVFSSTINTFLDVNYENGTTGLSLGEQLYTARGSQGVGIGA